MPTSCMPSGNRCGTHVIGWLTNGHPRVADGRVKNKAHFHPKYVALLIVFSEDGRAGFS